MKTFRKIITFTLLLTFSAVGIAIAEKSEAEVYIVKKGESLSIIAKEKYGDANLWPQLATYNEIDVPSSLRAGQKILIPAKSDLPAKVKEFKKVFRIPYTTDFEDIEIGEKPIGWEFPSGGVWGIAHTGTRVLEQAKPNVENCAAVIGGDNWANYTVRAAIKIEHSGDGGIFVYWQSHYANYRLRVLNRNRVELVKREPTGPEKYNTLTLDAVPFPLKDSVWYIFKLEVANRKSFTYLRGKLWEKGTTEPGTWLLEASDYSVKRYNNGKAGLWTNRHGSSYRGAKFDNFNVKS